MTKSYLLYSGRNIHNTSSDPSAPDRWIGASSTNTTTKGRTTAHIMAAEAKNSNTENLTCCCSACGKAAAPPTATDAAAAAAAAAFSADGLKCCSVCRTVQYCNVDCQKSDWPLHKKACTQVGVKLLIDAIVVVVSDDKNANNNNNNNNIDEEISRLSNFKRVLNGKVNYKYNSTTFAKWTALHACVRLKNTAAMRILLQHGANPEIKNANGETPLFVASTSHCPALVQCLLDHGNASPNATLARGEHGTWTCLMMAAREGDYEITEALLKAGAIVDLSRDAIMRTVLDISLITLHGPESGLRIKLGETPREARERMSKTCKVLFDHGLAQQNSNDSNNNQSR